MKKIVIGVGVALVVLMVGGFFWARSVLGGDAVRLAIAQQLSSTLGQPVTIGSISASPYPRVTVNLTNVRIGARNAIQLGALEIGTNFRALLSRRIEHGTLRLKGATLTLPLPPFPGLTTASPNAAPASGSPIEIVSIDEVILNDVQIVSGGRTLRGDIELVPQGVTGVQLRKIALIADDATITATGEITNLAGPVGTMSLKSSKLDVDRLLAFANEFSAGAGLAATPAGNTATPAPATGAGMDLVVSLDADSAVMGDLTLDKLTGRAHITDSAMTIDPVSFGVFGGKYGGSLKLTLGAVPDVTLQATLTGIDVAAATAFAGSPGTVTGRMSGRLDIAGRGADAAALTDTAKGTLRVDVVDGVVKNLGLVQAVVVATSMRSGSMQSASTSSQSKDEPFSKLSGTFALANGVATTNDLSFVSTNLNLSAQGNLLLSAETVNLKGRVQLSDALSKQAGQDLVRYTQEEGKVTLPATISGPASSPSVRIDVGDMAKRAITNAATEQAQKQLKSGLGGLFKK